MNHGFATFEDIIEEVKSKTGITNLRNRYDEIKKMICHAEREINPYSGHLVKKRMIHFVGNGSFDGKRIKKPFDYVTLDNVGNCEDKFCPNEFRETPGHIIVCDNQKRDNIQYIYWGYQTDSNGNIVTTRNHQTAVVTYIIHNLISQRYFMKEASLREVQYWDDLFHLQAKAARGEDFFPYLDEMDSIAQTNSFEKQYLNALKIRKDCCLESICIETYSDEVIEENENTDFIKSLYFFQNYNLLSENQALEAFTDFFLSSQQNIPLEEIVLGKDLFLTQLGRIVLVLKTNQENQFKILDSLNNDITETTFVKYYSQTHKKEIFISKELYVPSNIFIKFEEN